MAKTKIASNAQFSGTQKGLSVVLDRCYAYSGPIQVNGGSYTEHLNFTTGKNVIEGSFTFSGPTLPANTPTGQLSIFRIKLNGVVIMYAKVDTLNEDMPSVTTIPFLIPPLSIVQVNAENGDSTTNMVVSSIFVGRIYDA